MSITKSLTQLKIDRRIQIAKDNDLKSVAFETVDISKFVTSYYRLLDRLVKAEKTNKELRSEIKFLLEGK